MKTFMTLLTGVFVGAIGYVVILLTTNGVAEDIIYLRDNRQSK